MENRRTFVKQMASLGLLSAIPDFLKSKDKKDLIWACLIHLSFNMWEEYISPHRPFRGFRPYLRFDDNLWDAALEKMANQGINMVVIDLGDGIKYESHPEIAVKGAWSKEKLEKELKRLRNLGIEPIPKLNFSAGHDTWMKDYSHMVSSAPYYKFVKEIVHEVIELFDSPRFFHIGMDEETAAHQSHYKYIVVRQDDQYWGDFHNLIGVIEEKGVRAWCWSDYIWNHPELFFKNMPKSVIQSNWYYGENFDINSAKTGRYVKAYLDLEKHKYDQIPTGSFHDNNPKSIGGTVEFAKANISEGNLMGFLQTFWKPTIPEYRNLILDGIDLLGQAKKKF